MQFIRNSYHSILILCFVAYTVLSWILLLRDGRAMYAIANFYPQVTPFIKAVEPSLISYGINSIPTIAFFAITLVAFYCYYQSLWQKISLKKTIVLAFIFQAIVFLSYPSLATDIFSYMFSDRVATVYNQNVWKVRPLEYAHDPFSRLADWQELTKVYGGVNQFFYNFASQLGGDSLIGNVITYKLLVWIFVIATLYVMHLLLKENDEIKSMSLRLVFWNPLFVLESVGAGHNDILMIFFTLLGYYLYLKKKWLLAGIVLAMAVQVKLIAVLLVPFLCIQLFLQKKYLALISLLSAFLLSNQLVFFYMQIDVLTFLHRVSQNIGVYWQSLPSLVHHFYTGEKIFFSSGFVIVLGMLALYQLIKQTNPLLMYAIALLLYLFFFTTAYWNWYVLWTLPLIPFIASPVLSKAIVMFTFTSTLAYPIFWLALRFNHEHILWHILRYITLMGIPLGTLVRALVNDRKRTGTKEYLL